MARPSAGATTVTEHRVVTDVRDAPIISGEWRVRCSCGFVVSSSDPYAVDLQGLMLAHLDESAVSS